MGYIVKRHSPETQYGPEEWDFFYRTGRTLNERYGNRFPQWERLSIAQLAARGYFAICYLDGRPVGVMVGSLHGALFDPTTRVLRQELMYAETGFRTAKMLLDDFIDFGTRRANHIIVTIAEHSRLRAANLQAMGFEPLQAMFRMEV